MTGTWAYALHRIDRDGQHWLRVQLSDEGAAGQRVPVEEWKRYQAPEEFRRAVASIVQPGMTIVVTPDSLQPGALVAPATVLEGEQEAQQKQ